MSKDDIVFVSDTTFKYLLKKDSTRKWIERLIYEITGPNLNGYILVDNEINSGNRKKDYCMDLVFQKENDVIVLEVNRNYYDGIDNKSHEYLYAIMGHMYEQGESYKKKIKGKLITINNYNNIKNKDIEYTKYLMQSKEYPSLIYDNIEIHEIYLRKVHNKPYNDCNNIHKKLWLLGSSFEEMKKLKDDENKIIIEEMEVLSMNNNFLFEYDVEVVRKN